MCLLNYANGKHNQIYQNIIKVTSLAFLSVDIILVYWYYFICFENERERERDMILGFVIYEFHQHVWKCFLSYLAHFVIVLKKYKK